MVAFSFAARPATSHFDEGELDAAELDQKIARLEAKTEQYELERAVLRELNVLRADPAAYAVHVDALRGKFDNKLYIRAAGLAPILTTEGEPAVVEAARALRASPPARSVSFSEGLARAAHAHVLDQGPTGAVGHRGTDGSNSLMRISRHGRSLGRSGEVIDYGWSDARDIVVDLLIDDGIADRSHRRTLLDPRYTLAGASCGPHARYKIMCVVELAERFVDGDTGMTFADAEISSKDAR